MDERELPKVVGAAARTTRAARGLTQADVAERAAISVEFYSRIERGVTLPSVPTLVRLAGALGVTTDALVGSAPLAPLVRESGPPYGSPSLRRLVRRLERADARTLRLLHLIANEFERRG